MKLINYSIMLLFTLIVVAGCSDNSSTTGSDSTLPVGQDQVIDQIFIDYDSYSLQLSASTLSPGTLLSHGGQLTVRAFVSYTTTDSSGVVTRHPAADGTLVNFFVIDAAGTDQFDTILNAGAIESPKVTVGGYADAVYTAKNYAGIVKIYANAEGDYQSTLNNGQSHFSISDTYSFEVAAGEPVSIKVESVTPAPIYVAGAGKTNTSLITFSFTDNADNPVADYSPVSFTLSTPLGGGEKLSATEGETQDGRVSVSLIGGTVSGTLGVNATYYDTDADLNISTEAKVTIVSGLPAAERLSMAVEYFNLAGGRTSGLQDDITAYLGDRYGNVVPDGTTVSFMSECGTIGTSDGFQSTTTRGVALASLQTSAPTVPNLGGVDGTGNEGLCTIVAYTPGDEGFNDINGNNIFDEGTDVQTIDMSEPYIDGNDNGVYDSGEKYIDVDGSGLFTEKDGVYQSNTMIWDSQVVLISGEQAPLNLEPTSFNFATGGTQTFSYWLGDVWGNALVGGTTVKVTTDDDDLSGSDLIMSGDVDITVTDSPGAERQYSFTVTIPSGFNGTFIKVNVEVTPNGGTAGANSAGPVSATALGHL